MPELVANGPDIPVSLLNRLDSGTVVFFCGAGVSATHGSDLPGFGELVEYVYEANHMEPDGVEREALDCDAADAQRRRPSFDRLLAYWRDASGPAGSAKRLSHVSRSLRKESWLFTKR